MIESTPWAKTVADLELYEIPLIRAARYEESMRYAITLLNVAITILLAINEQILKCTNFCLSD